MPFIADQPYNIKKVVQLGFALAVDKDSLDKQTFKATILEVLTNPK